MTFDDITHDGRLWAVRYDGEDDNVLYDLIDKWNDVLWLRLFFKQNWADMCSFYSVVDVNQAIEDTIEDADVPERKLLDASSSANLDELFHPLENFRTSDALLGKEKARPKVNGRHSSWLRLYAIKLSGGVHVITGGAIKLTLKMEERDHTRAELAKLEKVRNFLLSEGVIDDDSFIEYMNML